MNQEQARRLISETFHNDFSKERFVPFIKEFLNDFDESKKFPPFNSQYVRAAFRERIASYERVGQFTDRDGKIVDVLVINLHRETTLERGRAGLRNFIADYLTNTDRGAGKAAVLAAYVSPEKSDWRFSFVTLETELAQNEKGKFKEEIASITPARRKSFLVGKYEKTHTAQTRFLKWIESEQKPTLNEIEACFDVESVTKEFFQKYKQLFEKTRDAILEVCERDEKVRAEFIAKGMCETIEDANSNKIKKPYADDFAKKLLGQIVFLYFLQKKGWFGVNRGESWGDGDRQFLRSIFEDREKYKQPNLNRKLNFYEDILEPLFYNTLAIKRPNDWSDRFHCKIPFLNGGLFEAIYGYDWSEFELLLPDTLFSDKQLKTDEGGGILDVFDLYNFTINEAEPLETEVAVDPEMLGKIFENLLPENIRHGSGTYYTPRVIVAYMCQQSLINYLATHLLEEENKDQKPKTKDQITREDIETLIRFGAQAADYTTGGTIKDAGKFLPESIIENAGQIDELLQKITVCDPAIGSGAFPVGMMQEIVKAREALRVSEKVAPLSNYELKRRTIENALYGVDIDAGAVEIAKLRLWLSLIVDETNFQNIEPLPNLDYKIMQGNSLLDEFHGVKLIDDKLFERKAFDKNARIAEINAEISNLQKELGAANVGRSSSMYILTTRRIAELKKEKAMFADGAGDVQFGLYAEQDESQIKLENLKAKIKQFFDETDAEKKKKLRREIDGLEWEFIEAKLLAEGKADELANLAEATKERRKNYFLWQLNFPEIFQNGGFDVVIANPPYLDSETMVKTGMQMMRDYISKSYKTAKGNWDIYVAFIEKGFNLLNPFGNLVFITPDKWISKPFGEELRKTYLENIKSIVVAGRNVFESANVDSIISFFLKKKSQDLQVFTAEENKFSLLNSVSKKILKPPYALDLLFSNSLSLLLKIESGNIEFSSFLVCENACATSDAYKIKPFILNKENFSNEYFKVVNTGTIDKYISKWGRREMTYLKDKYLYPSVSRKVFETEFKNSYYFKSVKPKILIKGLTLLDACIDELGEIIPGKSTLVITSKDKEKLKIALGLINSKLFIFYIKEKYSSSSYNQGINFTKDMINQMPLPNLSNSQKAEIENLVEQILEKKRENPLADTGKLESEIDRLVYKLYDLTDEEKDIVEGKV